MVGYTEVVIKESHFDATCTGTDGVNDVNMRCHTMLMNATMDFIPYHVEQMLPQIL